MIYVFTMGEYSSYEILGIYKGPPGLDIAATRKRWVEAWKQQGDQYLETIAREWLKENGFEEVEWQEIWAGEDWGT